MQIQFERLMDFAARLGDQILLTPDQDKPFQVSISRTGGLRFVTICEEEDGRKPSTCRETKVKVSAFLESFNRSASLSPSHYKDETWCASYLLALVKAYSNALPTTGSNSLLDLEEEFLQNVLTSELLTNDQPLERALRTGGAPSVVRATSISFVRNP